MNTRTLPAKDFERADALFRRRKFVNLVAVALANLAALFGLGGVLHRYKPEGDSTAIAICCLCSLVVHPVTTYGLGLLFQLPAAPMRSSTGRRGASATTPGVALSAVTPPAVTNSRCSTRRLRL